MLLYNGQHARSEKVGAGDHQKVGMAIRAPDGAKNTTTPKCPIFIQTNIRQGVLLNYRSFHWVR